MTSYSLPVLTVLLRWHHIICIKAMFGSSLPLVVCRSAHILFTLFVFAYTHSVTSFVLFVFVLCTLCCQFLYIVLVWLPLLYSLTFIYLYLTVLLKWHHITYLSLTMLKWHHFLKNQIPWQLSNVSLDSEQKHGCWRKCGYYILQRDKM